MATPKLSVVGVEREFSKLENPGLKLSFQISGHNRSNAVAVPIDNPKEQIYQFVFEDNTTWICEYEKFDVLFPEKSKSGRAIDQDFQIPDGLVDDTQTRTGIFGKIALQILNIFAKEVVKVGVKALAEKYEKKHLNDQSGLYFIDGKFELNKVEASKLTSAASYILFIHGTFSSTKGSFSELFNTELWKQITDKYPDKVLAFQHETVTKSPLQNVVELVASLPKEISLNIVSHSRGGLVADILSKYANNQPFTDDNIKLLKEEGRESDIDAINALNHLFKERKINIERFVRVCCPASGTILAGGRIANFVNIALNLIGLTNPVFSFIQELLVEIIKTKDNIKVLPGLEAMNPESPFIKILNDPRQGLEIDDNLIVLSASSKAQISLKGLMIIVTRLCFGQRNDMVVNTDSMYLGAKRKNEIQYYFDESDNVTHVSIFEKVETQKLLSTIFKAGSGERIPEFKQFAQSQIPDSDRNINLNKIIPNGSIKNLVSKGKKPILILLPGIMGSTLTKNDDSVWLNYGRFLTGGLFDLKIESEEINASGVVKSAYNRIYEKLSEKYEVETFAYDWRKSLSDTATQLKDRIEELLAFQQPIKVLAHSMGGVLFRDFAINHDATWQKLNKNKGFKIVHLGTPFRGSMRMASVLIGQDGLIKTLAKIDLVHTKNGLLNVFNKFPGVYCLLPLENPEDFADLTLWEKFSEASEHPLPPVPTLNELSNYKNYRDKIISKIDSIDYSNMIYVAGKGNRTDDSFYLEHNLDGSKTLKFMQTPDGDESVTWEKGIPKQLIDSKSVYYAQCVHGELANDPKLFDAIGDLLENGSTTKLERTSNNLRSSTNNKSSSTDLSFDLSLRGFEASILGLSDEKFDVDVDKFLEVLITNGDLKYSKFPLLAGHFENDFILNSEKAIDNYLFNILSVRNDVGLYPSEIGTNELFLNNNELYSFSGAIIVGLGKISELSKASLSHTIELAVLKYLIEINSKSNSKNYGYKLNIGISALLIGNGSGIMSIDASSKSIIRGIYKANSKIKSYFPINTVQITQIEFIERYEDKASSCFYVLSKASDELKIVIKNKKIDFVPGAKSRKVYENTDEWWNRISVVRRAKRKENDQPQMTFSISSKRASEDRRDVSSGTEMLDSLIKSFSKDRKWNERIAHTIFELMIPNDFKENLKNKGSIIWILDKETANYPWELLKDQNDLVPLSINSGMVRQLSSNNTRKTINYVAKNNALIIADPNLEGFVSQLPGAEKEGNLTADLFLKYGIICDKLIGSNSLEILTSIFPNNYKIVHLAGHGDFNEENPMNSGMIIGNNQFLTTAQLTQMSNVPEFVFVNCCYLGGIDDKVESRSQNRNKFAANIGTELIDMGVKAVIAAGWEVNDTHALRFAEVFYNAMFQGYSFGEAILKARREIYTFTDNTWGAYQCYGDPNYKFNFNLIEINQQYSAEEAENELRNLLYSLETGSLSNNEIMVQLENISDSIKKADNRNDRMTELEAVIYAEIGEYANSCTKYENLIYAKNANFHIQAVESYNNILTKSCVFDYENKLKKLDELIPFLDKAIKNINALIDIAPTSERYSILGNAYKRKGYLIDNEESKLNFYYLAMENYKKAEEYLENTYIFSNWACLEILLTGKSNTKINKQKEKYLKDLNNNLYYGDFLSLVTKNEILIVDLIINPTYDLSDIIKNYKLISGFTGSKGKILTELQHLQILIDVAKLKKDTLRTEKLNQIYIAF